MKKAMRPPEMLDIAVLAADLERIREAVAAGADPNATDRRGRTKLHFLALHDKSEACRLLAALGARVDTPDEDGKTPLYYAAEHGAVSCVRALAELGADVDAKDGAGWTPLHMAAYLARASSVRLLLELGADPQRGDLRGKTPLDLTAPESDTDERTRAILLAAAEPKTTTQRNPRAIGLKLTAALKQRIAKGRRDAVSWKVMFNSVTVDGTERHLPIGMPTLADSSTEMCGYRADQESIAETAAGVAEAAIEAGMFHDLAYAPQQILHLSEEAVRCAMKDVLDGGDAMFADHATTEHHFEFEFDYDTGTLSLRQAHPRRNAPAHEREM